VDVTALINETLHRLGNPVAAVEHEELGVIVAATWLQAHSSIVPHERGEWRVVSMRTDAALGVFVVGLAVLMIGVVKEFNVALLVIGGLLMFGSVAATTRQRRTGPDPEVTLRPGGKDRPWRRR
jgi:hypothetical protein